MIKIITILLFSFSILFSKQINFTEEKFISALNSNSYKKGIFELMEDNELIFFYENQSPKYIFRKDFIEIIENDKNSQISYEDNIELSIFSKLIKAIYFDDDKYLEGYFIRDEKDYSILIPNDYISNVIEKISYKKEKNKLKNLTIFFLNEDRIKIEEN